MSLALGACGGGAQPAGQSTSTTTTAAPEPPPTTTVAPPPEAQAFCDLSRAYAERVTKLLPAFSDPLALKEILSETNATIERAIAAAPPEVKPDMVLLAETSKRFVVELEKVNFDARALPTEVLTNFQTPESKAAAGRLQVYNRDVCGIGAPGPTSAP